MPSPPAIELSDLNPSDALRLSDGLKELQLLSTQAFETLADAISTFLRTGRKMFDLPLGMVLRPEGEGGVAHATEGESNEFFPGVRFRWERTHWPAGAGLTTVVTRDESAGAALYSDLRVCIGAPVLVGDEMFGILCFCSPEDRGERSFTRLDEELIESMAHGLARSVRESRLEFRARHDALTGLANRSYFLELLDEALAKASRENKSLAVLYIDLDRFKQVNDTLGHAAGDRLLRDVADRLRNRLDVDDLAGRMGGDEFTVGLARPLTVETAFAAAWEFLEAFRAPYRIDGQEIVVTASIGVSLYPKDCCSALDLLRAADLAMYEAKRSGKNGLRSFVAQDHELRIEGLHLEHSLRGAIAQGELELLYQPLVKFTGRLDGFEALLSWRHPKHGPISPKKFIPIAEETGLIVPIGSWVLQQACLQGSLWRKAGYPTRISVNVSAVQFESDGFVETVADALALGAFPPGDLDLELTESIVMRDVQESARRMSILRELGVSISIDDFGTGYSSLSYLSKLPVDSLKIDQSFVRSIQEQTGSLPVVQTIIRLAHNMNLTVIAEGVETMEELDLLRLLGCDKVQGHLYGRPLCRDEATRLLASGESALRPR